MVLSDEHLTRAERAYLPDHDSNGAVPERDDRVVSVRHRAVVSPSYRLHPDQCGVLRALIAHLMPVDDGASSQVDTVMRYIDWLVTHERAGLDVPLTLADVYGAGCEHVQEHACRVYGCEVQAMSAAERDQLVWDMLEGSMDGFDRFSPAHFFHTLRRHIADAMQGGAITPN